MTEQQATAPMSRAEARAYDAAAIARGIPGSVLMTQAARGVVEVLLQLFPPGRDGRAGPFGIACGKGNNGGDGLTIARLLHERGHAVTAVLAEAPERLAGDAAWAWRTAAAAGLATPVFDGDAAALRGTWRNCVALVDALLGTGFVGVPRPPYDTLIDALNAAGPPVVAVDVPSGLDADTGAAAGAVIRAAATVTFVAPKRGFGAPGAAAATGQVFVKPILP